MQKNVAKNYVFNLIYQLFLIIIPIVVTPYVSRVLGVDGSGLYSYAYSILTYFTLFAALGFGFYAQRLVASHQGDKVQQSKDFWSVFIARLIPVNLTLALYAILISVNLFGDKYSTLMWVFTIDVAAVIFDVSFFFQGNEEFGKIVVRNVLIKSLSIICIFIFVKNKNDLLLYALIQSAAVFLSNASLWLYLPKYLVKVKLKELAPLKHLLPTFILFLPTIATSVYTSLDKTMIGLITGQDAENGNYEYAEKFVKMAMTVITALGTVMIPRNSQSFAEGDFDAIKNNIFKSCKFVMLVGLPIVLGVVAVADNLIPWYLGEEYDKAANIMKILSPIIVIIGFSNVFGLQFLVPCHMDKKYIVAIISGAVVNFGLNLGFIFLWGSYGAAISTVAAELVVTLVMLIFIRKYLNFGKVLLSSWKYMLSSVVMFVPCYFLGLYLSPTILHTLIIACVGVLIYALCLLILRDEFVFKVIKAILGKFKKKNQTENGE